MWRQAALAEFAAGLGTHSADTFLDLVKCFDRVPHDVLAAKAALSGYSLWILRAALAAYRIVRRISSGGAVSVEVFAERGITAGSGFAVIELRVLLLECLDEVAARFPDVPLGIYVDDANQHAAGPEARVVERLSAATLALGAGVAALRLDVSASKSCGVASSVRLAAALQLSLAAHGVKFQAAVKQLGVDRSSGRRRFTQAQHGRLTAFKRRLPRLARLRRAGVSTARIMRTGGLAALNYGQSVLGVADGPLRRQRQAVAKAV